MNWKLLALQTHSGARIHLADYAAGSLEPDQKAAIQNHIDNCADCREWLGVFDLFEAVFDANRWHDLEHPTAEKISQFAIEPIGIDESEKRVLKEHLNLCPFCALETHLCERAVSVLRNSDDQAGIDPLRLPTDPSPTSVGARVETPHRRLAVAVALVVTLLGAYLFSPMGDPMLEQQTLSDTVLSGKETIEARGTIIATSTRVEANADVIFRAENVIMGNGFSVGKNAKITIETSQALSKR